MNKDVENLAKLYRESHSENDPDDPIELNTAFDIVEHLEYNVDTTIEEIEKTLTQNGIDFKRYVLKNDSHVVFEVFKGELVVFDDGWLTSYESKEAFMLDYKVSDELEELIQNRFNEDFWDYPASLYHATSETGVMEIIKEEGLETSSGTGLSNRGTRGVFTVDNVERLLDGTYGYFIFEINTKQMKADGFTPFVMQEPDVVQNDALSLVAHKIRYHEYSNYISSDIWIETVVVTEPIPAKYLTILD
jgi:hypothetical protein